MKKATTILCLCIFVVVFVFMFVFGAFLPRTTESNYDVLKKLPEFSFESLLSGEYLNQLKDYYTDTIHLRDEFVDFEARIRALYGIKDNNEQLIETKPGADEDDTSTDVSNNTSNNTSAPIDNSGDNSDESQESIAPEVSDSESSDTIETPDDLPSTDISDETSNESSDVIDKFEVEEIESRLIIIGTRIFEIYGGDRENSDGTFDIIEYAKTLNEFAIKVGPDVKIYSMVIPKACAYYLQQSASDKYDKYLNKDRDDINTIGENLSENVIDVNIYNILGRHANEDIYFRTDHHWTALGAYYASSVFAETAGVALDPITEFTVTERPGFLGSLYGSSNGSTALLNNPEVFKTYYPNTDYTVTYYDATDLDTDPTEHEDGFFWNKSDNQKSNWYSTFINGDRYSLKAVSNECKNGRKLLIVKDSYGNALAPFLMEGFEEVYVVDARKYENRLSDTIEKFGITDVLFTECTFSAASSGYVSNLKELCE